MRRLHLIFAIVVVTAFVSAFLAERSRPVEPAAAPLPGPPRVGLTPLDVERGEHSLVGVIRDHAGDPAAEVTIHATPLPAGADAGSEGSGPDGREPFFFGHSDDAGAFELGPLTAGRYALLLIQPGVRNTTSEVVVPSTEELVLRLNAPYDDLPPAPDPVYLTMVGAVRRPNAIAGLGVEAELSGLEVLLLPRDDEARWRGAMERRAPVDAQGRFRIEELAVADHTLAVVPAWARGGTWPFLASRDLSADEIARAGADESPEAVEVELGVGELEGRLFDTRGRPVEGALLRIRAVGDGAERAWPALNSDPEGRFLARDLPAAPGGSLYEIEVFGGGAHQVVQAEVRLGARREVRFGPLDTRSDAE